MLTERTNEGRAMGMWRRKLGRLTPIFLALFASLGSVPAAAQNGGDFTAPISPIEIEPDRNGVNLATGAMTPPGPVVSVPAAPRLRFDRIQNAAPFVKGDENENYAADGSQIGGNWTVHNAEGASEAFTCQMVPEGFYCDNIHGSGSALVKSGRYYTQKDTGARYTFGATHLYTIPARSDPYPKWLRLFYVTTIAYPDGEVISYQYNTAVLPTGTDPYNRTWFRPAIISSNRGYYLTISYQGSVLGEAGWGVPSVVALFKDGSPNTPLSRLTYTSAGATDLAGRLYAGASGGDMGTPTEDNAFSQTLPGLSSPSLVVTAATAPGASELVGSVTSDGATYNYTWANPQFTGLLAGTTYSGVTVTGPEGYNVNYGIKLDGARLSIGFANRVKTRTDSLGRLTSWDYDLFGRLSKVTAPENNSVTVQYDAAGNISLRNETAKPNSGLPSRTQQSYVDLTQFGGPDGSTNCNNQVMCWRPQWTKDAKLLQTDYAYNATGQLTDMLEPADATGVRRRTHIDYTAGFIRKSAEYICGGSLSTCTTAIVSRTEYTYWGNTSLPVSVRQVDPATNAYLETTYTYDDAGRVLSEDGPLPGSDDAKYFRYDNLGRRTWEIGPKGEAGYRQAARTTFRDVDDKPTKVESGRLASADPADPTLILFSQADTTYDAKRNPTRVTVSSGGTPYQITDTSYDLRNRAVCATVRMNPAVFASLPADACTLGTSGTQGPDRITKNVYDAADQITKVQKAYGTPLQQDYATYEYTLNAKMKALVDARGYRAEMTWDGFDRQTKWIFPNASTAGVANATDYEAYTYDNNDNRLTVRKRDGKTLTFGYDGLDRMTSKLVPTRSGLSTTHSRDVAYTYDLRNLPLTSKFSEGTTNEGLTTTFDAYGRPTTNSFTMDGATRALTNGYNAAGNRTALTFPDSQTFAWSYLTGGQFNQLLDPSGTVLVDYGYDDHDRLSGAARISSAHDQSWGYDAFSRLSSLAISNGGSSLDAAWGFTRNAASQIASQTLSNDTYTWAGTPPASLAYAANGLNQYTAVGGNGYCYDANGNLTADGSKVYLYDVENRLVEMRARVGSTCPATYGGTIMAALRYDPLGRLYEVVNYEGGVSKGPTRFLLDGDALVAEYNGSGTMLQRHIHGPAAGADDPLVNYSGASTALGTARFLSADPRGSIVLRTDSVGTSAQVNTYDEWGVGAGTNVGRFQYTGQAWLAELGMYYYKARMYSPTLGRMMQTDPIGYHDQVNLYGYIGNDPVNAVDPTGMAEMDCTGSRLCGGREGLTSGLSGSSTVSPIGSRPAQNANAAPERNNGSQGSSSGNRKGVLSEIGDALDSAGQAMDVAAAETHRTILIARGILFKDGPSYTIYTLTPESLAVAEFYGLAFAIGQMPRLVPNQGPGSLGGSILDIKPGFTVMLRNSSSGLPTIEFMRRDSTPRRQEFKFEQPKL